MKRAISLILAIMMCLSLCACGSSNSNDNDLSQFMPQKVEGDRLIEPRKENAKGSRSKPYALNEEIKFSSVDINLKNMYTTTVKVSKLSASELESAKNIYKKAGGVIYDEAYSVSFEIKCVKGDNGSSINDRSTSNGCFLKNGLNENMSKTYFDFFDKDTGKRVYDLYPDVKYELYMAAAEKIDCKYITFEYRIGEYETETLWIEVD